MAGEATGADQDELRVFVSSTLQAIMAGIADAQSSARVTSAHGTGIYAFSAPEQVAFDIAVHATRSGKVGGGLKVEVFSIGANAEKGTATEDSKISRIAFSVPTKFKSTNGKFGPKKKKDFSRKSEPEERPEEGPDDDEE